MTSWKVIALLIPILFVTYQSLIRLLPKGTSLLLVNAYSALVGAVIMIALYFLTSQDHSLKLSGKPLMIALGIGALISLGNFGIIKALSLGAPQSIFTPFFYITLIVYGVLAGVLFFRESLNIMQILGVLTAATGVAMIFYFKKS